MGKLDFLTTRVSEGLLRIIISVIYMLIAIFFLYEGVKLIKIGAMAEWKILTDFQGMTLYVTSLSPGIFVILSGMLIMCWGLPNTIKNLK